METKENVYRAVYRTVYIVVYRGVYLARAVPVPSFRSV